MLSVLCTALLAGGLALWWLPLTYDLTWFLPAPERLPEQVLTERVGEGPGAQLLFLELSTPPEIDLATLKQELAALPAVEQVLPASDGEVSLETLPDVLLEHRLLLTDLPASEAAWAAVLEERLADVQAAFDDELIDLIGRDPSLGLLTLAEQLRPAEASVPVGNVLLLLTRVPAFDLAGQKALLADVEALLPVAQPHRFYGAGAYGVTLNETIRKESILFSILASVALLALIAWRFRRWHTVFAIGLPLLAGAACGALVLALSFSQVHGITLAFGFTLLGVVIDYPLHLASHRSSRSVWPTLNVGLISTVTAYLAFLASGTEGLAQLGVFAAAGIVGAALAAGWLFKGDREAPAEVTTLVRFDLRMVGWLLALALFAGLAVSQVRLNADLGALTPLPEEWRRAEAQLRSQFSTLEQRYLLAVTGTSLEDALRETEQAMTGVQAAIDAALLDAAQPITLLLPGEHQQRARQRALGDGSVLQGFEAALLDSEFEPALFQPFVDDLATQAVAPLLTYDAVAADPRLQALLAGQLYPVAEGYRSLILLRGVRDPDALAAQFSCEEPGGQPCWVDLKQASINLVSRYQERFLKLLLALVVLLPLLLLALTGSWRRALWCSGTLSAAVLGAAWLSSLVNGSLALFELIGLLLVAGLGLDYALFFSRLTVPVARSEAEETRGAVGLCALSSLLVFGILAGSSVPLLRGLGSTVAVGVLLAYLLARFGVGPARSVPPRRG